MVFKSPHALAQVDPLPEPPGLTKKVAADACIATSEKRISHMPAEPRARLRRPLMASCEGSRFLASLVKDVAIWLTTFRMFKPNISKIETSRKCS
jgi:hypothetical protein